MKKFLVLAALAASLLPAQVLNGRIEVAVTDPSGQAIAGAKVSIRDLRRQSPFGAPVVSDTTGVALFAAVRPSEYEINVEAPGFRKSIISGFELNASQTLRQTVMLEIGSVSESIQVEANAVAINTADATIAKTINMKSIDTLPQLGRSPLSLVALVPGSSVDPGDSTFSRINGTRQGSNNSRLDGIDANDAVVPRLGLSMTAVNVDSLEEVRVITNGGKAEYGRNAGGQVEMVTRSGGNAFHGNAFEFLRNTSLNANNFFNNAGGTKRPVFIQNIFGGSGSGPIIKNRIFFYGNFQGRRTSQGVIRNRTVLSNEAKQGIFRWAANGVTNSYNIPQNDPAGRGIDPKMKDLMALMPSPNNSDVGDGLNTQGFRFNVAAPSLEYQGTGKVDYQMSNTHRVFFRYSRQFNESIDSLNNAEQRYPGLPDGKQGGARWGFAIGSDWTITNWLVNEFRIGRQSATADFIRPYRESGIAVVSNLFDEPINTALGQGRNSPVIDITDNVSMLRGKHTYKAGFNFRRVLQYGYNYAGIYPNVSLSRTSAGNTPPAGIGPTGLTSTQRQNFEGLFNDVLGRVGNVAQTYYSDLQQFQEAGSPRVRNTLFRDLGLFFQDDWKVKSNLTLNLGVRWEYYGAPTEMSSLQGTLNKAANINPLANINDLTVQRTNKWFDSDKNNFAPRIGLAWDPFKDGKTSIRANYGLFYDRIIGATSNLVDGNTPGFAQALQTFPNNNTTARVVTVNGLAGTDLPVRPAAPVLTLPNNRQSSIVVFDPNLVTGYAQQANFMIQRQIGRNTVVDVGYVRTMGVKLFTWLDQNQPKINGDFLNSFRELQAFQASNTPVGAGNTLARIFGGAPAAITALGASTVSQGLAGAAADTLDRNNYTRYPAAGVSDFYLRNFPQYNQVIQATNNGRSSYNSLQATLSHRTRNTSAQVSYTYSKSIDNASDDGNGFTAPVDNYNLVNNRARGVADRPHVLTWFGNYALPFGKGQRWMSSSNGFVNRLVGGWDLGLLGVAQSGTVFSVTGGRRTAGSTLNTYANYSGDRTIGEVVKAGNGVTFFSPAQTAAFSYADAGQFGTSGRNAFRGPKFFNMDLSLVKRIPITEGIKLTYRAEMYNAFNNVMFSTPGASIVTPATFGRISSTVNAARVAQMALRLDF